MGKQDGPQMPVLGCLYRRSLECLGDVELQKSDSKLKYIRENY